MSLVWWGTLETGLSPSVVIILDIRLYNGRVESDLNRGSRFLRLDADVAESINISTVHPEYVAQSRLGNNFCMRPVTAAVAFDSRHAHFK